MVTLGSFQAGKNKCPSRVKSEYNCSVIIVGCLTQQTTSLLHYNPRFVFYLLRFDNIYKAYM